VDLSAQLWKAISVKVFLVSMGNFGAKKLWAEINGDVSPLNWPRRVLLHGKGWL